MMEELLKILILEDNTDDAEMVNRILRKSNLQFESRLAMNESAFLEALSYFEPHIIIADNSLPQFSAIEALDIIKKRSLSVPFILVTGTTSEEYAASIIKYGADDYILKDRLGRLPSAIESALKQRRSENERQEAMQMLVSSEMRYRHLLDNMMEGVQIIGYDWKFKYVNASMAKHAKYLKEELLGYSIMEKYPGIEDTDVFKSYQHCLIDRAAFNLETEFIFPDKSSGWFQLSFQPVPEGIFILSIDITERKKSEQLLLNERDKFVKLAETAPGLIYSFYRNKDGSVFNFPYANHAVESIFGFTSQELERDATILEKCFHPEEAAGLIESIEASAKQLSPWKREFRYLHPLKGEIWLEGHSIPKLELDETVLWHGILQDITDRKNADQAIKASEEKYRSLFQNSLDGILLTSPDGSILEANAAACEIFKMNEREMCRATRNTLVDNSDARLVTLLDQRKNMGKANGEINMFRKSGERFAAEISSSTFLDAKAEEKTSIIIRDITERRRSEEKLIFEKELSDTIINNLPGIFYLYNEQGKFQRWNKNFEKITGYRAHEIKNMHPIDFYDTDLKESIAKRIESVFKDKQDGMEALLMTKSGRKIPFYFNSISINYEGNICLMGMGIDISEQKIAEANIRELASHLQNIREEERALISREIHDELGQQLTGLKMDISWISKKVEVADASMSKKLRQILQLLDSTITNVRKIATALRPSILDDLGLVEAMEWQSQDFESRSGIPTRFSASIQSINRMGTIAIGLFRIYQESLTNVARHSQATQVTTTLQEQSENVILSITDDGKGFNLEKTVSKKTLGLLGMKERTLMMGGQYQIISRPGNGTKVIVTVPLPLPELVQ